MKALLLLPALALPLLFTGCETTAVDHHPRRTGYVEVDRYPRRSGYVERDVVVVDRNRDRYPRHYNNYEERDVVVDRRYRKPSTTVVIAKPQPYQPRVSVRYYSDARGRYYLKDGRRVYTSSGVHY